MGHFSASPGAIYPALRRLEQAGLIRGAIEKKNTLRPRKTYSMTEQGLKTLKRRLAAAITRHDIVWRLEELILRFAFTGEILGRTRSIDFLEELSSQIAQYVPDLREHVTIQRELGNVNGAYALEQGIAKYEATDRWARRVAKELTEV